MVDSGARKTKIDVTNINEKIYNLIKQRITRFEYPPGFQINIRKLQEELGVSNSPIKDALFMLAGEGLVNITSRKGCYVSDVSEKDLHELEDVRSVIEMGAVDIIAKGITDNQLKRLEKLYEATLKMDEDFEYSRFMERDSRFHLEIIKQTENQKLFNMYKQLNAHVQIVRFQFYNKRKKPLPWTHQDHFEILQALKERDPEKAREAVRTHRIKARDAFIKIRKESLSEF